MCREAKKHSRNRAACGEKTPRAHSSLHTKHNVPVLCRKLRKTRTYANTPTTQNGGDVVEIMRMPNEARALNRCASMGNAITAQQTNNARNTSDARSSKGKPTYVPAKNETSEEKYNPPTPNHTAQANNMGNTRNGGEATRSHMGLYPARMHKAI